MLWDPEPAKEAPLTLKTTLRHLGLVAGFVFMLVTWALGLEVAVPYLPNKYHVDVVVSLSICLPLILQSPAKMLV